MHPLKDRFKKAIAQALFLIIAGICLALSTNAVRHDGLPLVAKPAAVTVSISDAWSLFRQQRAVFLDVRDASEYDSAHLPDAIHVTILSVKDREAELKKLAAGKMLIAYCDGQGCNKAADLARALNADRIPVSVMPDGWQGWMDAGYPVDEGKSQ